MTLDEARALCSAAFEAADEHGIRVGVVVVDKSARTIVAQRHHLSYLTVLEIAERKAFTAANFGAGTHEMSERLNSIEYAIHIAQADPRLTTLKGGVPLKRAGEVVGGIGVSGGSADQDLLCCVHAVSFCGFG